MDLTITQSLLLISAGTIAGFINTIAGGGSFLTVPLLIFMGISPTVANATNRLGVFLQSAAAVKQFHNYGVFPVRFSLIVSIPALLGSIGGAYAATIVSDTTFKRYLALFMVLMTLVTFLKPKDMLQIREVNYTFMRWCAIWILFFLVGFYGGFIQAGVGFLILASMILTGYDFVAGNATKVFTVLLMTLVSLIIFIANDKVLYLPGIMLGVGSMVGATIGSRATVAKGNVFVQRMVVAMTILFAILLLVS